MNLRVGDIILVNHMPGVADRGFNFKPGQKYQVLRINKGTNIEVIEVTQELGIPEKYLNTKYFRVEESG